MDKSLWIKIGKWTAGIIGGLIGLMILIIAMVYVPFVQDYIIDKVLTEVNSKGTMKIDASRIRLKFPLRVEVSDFVMTQNSDTMVTLSNLKTRVAVLPLLSGRITVDNLSARDAAYKMGGPDSAMSIKVNVDNFDLWDTSVKLSPIDIDLTKADLDGGRVNLTIRNDTTTKVKPDSTSTTPLTVNAESLSLEHIDFIMSMEGTIDTLSAKLTSAQLINGNFDLAGSHINAEKVILDSIAAKYIYPVIAKNTATTAEPDSSATASAPWTVEIDKVVLSNSNAVYAASGAVPQPGLDMNRLEVSEINIEVDSFYNRAAEIKVPLKRLHAREKCGIMLNANGYFAMDSAAMQARGFEISTGFSNISLDALMGMGNLAADKNLPVKLDASATIAPVDIKMIMPALSTIVDALPQRTDLTVDIAANGTTGNISIEQLSAELPRCFSVSAKGKVRNPMEPDHISGNVAISGRIVNGNIVKRSLLDAKMGKTLNIPRLSLRGNVAMNNGTIDARIKAMTDTGTIALDAKWVNRQESYNGTLTATHFPVEAFLPTMGIRDLSTNIDIDGCGYNPMSEKMQADIKIDLKSVIYNNDSLTDIKLNASLHEGNLTADLSSDNPDAKFNLEASGRINPLPFDITFSGDVDKIDLHALGLMEQPASVTTTFNGKGQFDSSAGLIKANANIASINAVIEPSLDFNATDILIEFLADSVSTMASIHNHDMDLRFSSPMPLDSITTRLTSSMDSINKSVANYRFDIGHIQKALPTFDFTLNAGSDNMLHSLLNPYEMDFKSMDMDISNDSIIKLAGKVLTFTTGATKIDTLTVDMHQKGEYLMFDADIDNAPGTLDAFAHVCGRGFISGTKLKFFINQNDIAEKTGFKFGAEANIADSVLTLNLVPYDPIIGYKPWKINENNFISIDIPHKHIDADLTMKSEESSLRLYTEHIDSLAGQEDIVLNISDVKIADWISINPFAPAIKGNLSANMKLRQEENKMLNGIGKISLDDFYYGRERVGSFEVDADLTTNARGFLTAKLDLMVDSVKTITAYGSINDSTRAEPFMLDFRMIRFPLEVVNPFLPPSTARLSGTLNGTMDITGSSESPVFNGYIDFDSTTMLVNMLGTTFRFSDEKIPVDSNVVDFNKFTIWGVNNNPLTIDGIVDLRHLLTPSIDLKLNAQNMQIIGTTKPRRGADVYGKAFIDLDAGVNGTLSNMNVDASVAVLSGTNATYVMSDAQSVLQSQSTGDMVKFVNFADTSEIMNVDSVAASSSSMTLNAILTVQPGTTFNVDLSSDGKNKVSINGNGTMDYSMSMMGDTRFTGRFNITGGFARYTPPLMSEKLFNFEEGSYVAFNGDMMNPIINLHAVDNLRANVTQTGQNSRLITFNVGLGVTGTLQHMNVVFDLSTRDDITIQNELQSMSAEQRANQAMNLLLYNVYTGPGTKATSNLGANPLYSFLESQLNSWAANTIKGVDLSFGINQYDRTNNGATSTATSYSYRVSKSLFNDRFKIVIGGNYTNDSDPDREVADDLINDISFEYMLNKSGTMVIKIFRHKGFESILEGEITQTGVGFVYKRKIRNLLDMFRPFSRRGKNRLPQQGQVLNPVILPAENEKKEE